MRALVYTAPHEMTLRDVPRPQIAAGEVVARIDAVGICGSDMHAFHGHDPRRKPGLILGHELAGTIVAGPGDGLRVTANPLITCGECDYCVQGRDNLCSNRTMVGMTRPGACAEFMAIPAPSTADLRATVAALYNGSFGDLACVEEGPLAEGAAAFADLDQGRAASAKIVLRPH